MSVDETSKKNIEFIKKQYLADFGFDLTDYKNKGKSFYDSYQLLLTLDSTSEQFNFIFYHSLFGTIEYLELIKKVDISIYERYKKRLTNYINDVAFYGDMFELNIAWTLFQKKVVFSITEPPKPDFEILNNNNTVFIECTSVQFDFKTTPTKEKMLWKIKGALSTKMQKNYANSSTVLMVDITNLCYHSAVLGDLLTQAEVTKVIFDATKELIDASRTVINNFGSIMFFYFNSAKTSNGEPHWVLKVFDWIQNTNADTNLIQFLKDNLISNVEITSIEIPKFHH